MLTPFAGLSEFGHAPGAISPFTPSDLGSKWLIGLIGTSLGAVDSDVDVWPDTGPNNYSVTEVFPTFGPTVKTVGGRKVARFTIGLGGMNCALFAMPAEAVIFVVASTPAADSNALLSTSHICPITDGVGQLSDLNVLGSPTTNGLYPYVMKSGITLITIRVQDGYQRVYENGVPRAGFTRTVAGSTGLRLGADFTDANGYAGDIMAVYATDALTEGELANMHTWLGAQCGILIGTQPADPIRVITLGDSIMAGFDGSVQQTNTIAVRLQTVLGSGFIVENISFNGRTLDNIITFAPNQTYPFGEAGRNILLPWEYYNVKGESGATIAASYAQLCTDATAAGWRVVAMNDFHSQPNIPAAVVIVNAAASGYSVDLADVDLQSLRDDADAIDGVHLDAAGWDIVVGVVEPLIEALPPP